MFLHVTTHIKERKHDGLLKDVGGTGFPSFFVLEADGAVVGKHAGARSADGFAETVKKAGEFVELRKKAKAGDKQAQVDYLFARVRMGQVTVDELKKEAKTLTFTPEQKKVYRGLLANTMMNDVQVTAVGEAFLKMEKEGLIPENESKRTMFYYNIFRHADLKKDVALMERSFKIVEAAWSSNPRYAGFLKQLRGKIEKAKTGCGS